jgi:hypothetical protein
MTHSLLAYFPYFQKQLESLQGPRPVFSVGPQSTEKCGAVWVYVRLYIIYYNH